MATATQSLISFVDENSYSNGEEYNKHVKIAAKPLNDKMDNATDLDMFDTKENKDAKKKRNSRKRNRCDMSPEELQRLRERERKAQQSRRDRIRAQKKQSQGWNDDLALEALLDKKHDKLLNGMAATMVNIPVEPHHEPHHNAELFQDLEKDSIPPLMKVEQYHKQNSLHSNDSSNHSSDYHEQSHSLPGDYHDKKHSIAGDFHEQKQLLLNDFHDNNHSLAGDYVDKNNLLADDFNEQSHSLAVDYSEQKHSLVGDFHHDQATDSKVLSIDETLLLRRKTEEKKVKQRYDVASEELERIKQERNRKTRQRNEFEYRNRSPVNNSHKDAYSPLRKHSNNGERHSPRSHFSPTYSHYPGSSHHIYDTHHSLHRPTDRSYHSSRYLNEGRYLADMHYVDAPYHKRGHSSSYHHDQDKHMTSFYHNTSAEDKKRMVSRNVDRKKLSEEELEELRRRERDYQRERRARIRLEKAKSSHCDEEMMRFYRHGHHHMDFKDENKYNNQYHPHSPTRHSPTRHSPTHRSPTHYSPPRHYKMEIENEKLTPNHLVKKELSVSIPNDKRSDEKDSYYGDKEAELLQVVPKNREFEEMKQSPPEFHLSANLSPVNPVKKNVLESICSTLKKESPESINEDDIEDETNEMIVVQPSSDEPPKTSDPDPTMNENAKKPEITDEQLERRRKSNREAQRRRRARLKMIEERPSSALDNSSESTTSDILNLSSSYEEERLAKKCRMKVTPSRPESLYPEDFAYYPNEKYYGPVMKEIKSRTFTYDLHKFSDNNYRNQHLVPVIGKDSMHPYHHYNSTHRHGPTHRGHSSSPPPSHYHKHHSDYHQYLMQDKEKDLLARDRLYRQEKELNLHEQERIIEECISKDDVASPTIVVNPEEESLHEEEYNEPKSSRKRKQYAPRKVAPSANSTPDEDVDVTKISPDQSKDHFFVSQSSPKQLNDIDEFKKETGDDLVIDENDIENGHS